jgi:hypothetical protein
MNKNVYTSHCINTSSVLITSGFSLAGMEEVEPGRFTFIFERDEEGRLDEILKLYHSQSLSLPAHALLANFKFLKTQLNEKKRLNHS